VIRPGIVAALIAAAPVAIGGPNDRSAVLQPARQARSPVASRSIEGVWSFATLTPLERPAEFAGKPTLTDAEAAAFVRDTIERGDRDRRDGGAAVDVGRAVNDYWFERGTDLAVHNGRRMSSLIVDPPDGRLPPLTPAAQARAAARATDAREHFADHPENRSLQERCLSFNAGPPILPGPYNNFVQIYQFPNHIVIHTEMIHDARIVPLDGRPHARFLAFRTPRAQAWHDRLLAANCITDVRGDVLRIGFAIYHDDEDVERLVDLIAGLA